MDNRARNDAAAPRVNHRERRRHEFGVISCVAARFPNREQRVWACEQRMTCSSFLSQLRLVGLAQRLNSSRIAALSNPAHASTFFLLAHQGSRDARAICYVNHLNAPSTKNNETRIAVPTATICAHSHARTFC